MYSKILLRTTDPVLLPNDRPTMDLKISASLYPVYLQQQRYVLLLHTIYCTVTQITL